MKVFAPERALGLRSLTLAISAIGLALGGCNSSSSGPSMIEAQAVDGYLVNSKVFCDGVEYGLTGLAGRFNCPVNTDLFAIQGGVDVGFDETMEDGGIPFLGRLTAPSHLPYVTPVSTVLVEMASVNGSYNPDNFDVALEQLQTALGRTDLDPAADATKDMSTIKLNVQIQQFIKSFTEETDDYSKVVQAFAKAASNASSSNETLDLVNGAEALLSRINFELSNIDVDLAKNPTQIAALSQEVEATNGQVERATAQDTGTLATSQPSSTGQTLTIDRDTVMVKFGREDQTVSQYGLDDFEIKGLSTKGAYPVVVSNLSKSIGFTRQAVTVDRSVEDQVISLGFEIDATTSDDSRKLSVTTDGAMLTATQGDSSSIVVDVPDDTVINVTATDNSGTTTNARFPVSGNKTFSSTNSMVEIDLGEIEDKLAEKGITGFLERTGNYRVTLVVGGVRVGQTENGVNVFLDSYTVTANGGAVSGHGVKGYATFVAQ